MQVQYIFQSCFVIELESHILLFDYYKGELPTFSANKPLYVFVSHSHHDHYNPIIYSIPHPNITYIISNDVDNRGIKLGPNEQITVDDVEIQTLLSTDLGIAFVILVEGRYIYHAGDLHWWHWIGEPEEDNTYQKQTFQREINKIKHVPFTIMMTPLDPRLKEATSWGMEYILNNVTTTYIFPMHFFTKIKGMNTYIQQSPLASFTNIITIKQKGEIFTLP
jgi:L-ascorbate metabolism protein UlaG (beta-lactamase superfamily)